MKPRPASADAFELFQAHFRQILNMAHPLVQLAEGIDWPRFEAAFADSYSPDFGAPGKAIRLMVGLHYLKFAFNESDESLVAHWVENPYWQYFCGFTHFQHEAPLDPSSLSRWRTRVGAARLELLLQETVDLAKRQKQVSPSDLARVTVDTTVQEKNITHPTDAKLLHTAIRKLVQAATERGLRLRQSYRRVAKRAAVKVGRYAHARQFRRMRRELRRLRTWTGRLIREVTRQTASPDGALAAVLERAERIRRQQPQDSNKLYSWHEPEVRCISKGKARQRYEFGQKVALAVTNRGNWFVAARLMPDNPYDGHTLAQTLAAAEAISGTTITDAYVDKGYRGHGLVADHPGGGAATRVHIAGASSRGVPRSEQRRRRRRSAIEPKIGHLKNDHRVRRCFLARLGGDAINIVLAAAAANLRKLLAGFARRLRRFFLSLCRLLDPALARFPQPENAPCAQCLTLLAA